MAGRNRSMLKQASRYFSPLHNPVCSTRVDPEEFDESDMWGESLDSNSHSHDVVYSSPIQIARPKSKPDQRRGVTGTGPASLPVNIPDWSKILGKEYKSSVGAREWEVEGDGDEDVAGELGTGTWMPPHEMACRNRAASLSVHEGVGRTLKGRDMSRLRNAIWEKTGFQD